MPYIQRNKQGQIVAITAEPIRDDDTPVSLNDPEILQFLTIGKTEGDSQNTQYAELLLQDLQEIRILEDLIDLLTQKGVILFSELPEMAQQKILNKKNVREKLEQTNDILVSDNPLFI